jgi:hypothetical protein
VARQVRGFKEGVLAVAGGGNGGLGRDGWIHQLARIYGARGHGRLLSLFDQSAPGFLSLLCPSNPRGF